jgi:predicted bacteriocin transport accessory protein
MKKIVIILFSLSFLFLFTGCEKKETYLKDLSFSELQNKINSKDEFFFVVTQDGCSHCENFLPIFEETLNEVKVTGYNFNLTKLSDEENKKFDELFKVDGTPTTIFVKDGSEVSLLQRINGEASKDKVIQKLKNNGYVK